MHTNAPPGAVGQPLCIFFLIRDFLVEVALEIEGCTVREVTTFFRYHDISVSELLKYCFRDIISSARVLEVDLTITSLLVTFYCIVTFPVPAAT